MKTKIGIIIVLSFLLCAVVSAASVWGNYKGYAKVKVYVSGEEYKTKGVPPVILNGQVMLPLNVLKLANVDYVWDNNKQIANIKQSESTIVEVPVEVPAKNNQDVEKVKALFKASDYYKRTEALGGMITDLSRSFSLSYDSISYGDGSYLQKSNEYLSQVIELYNGHIDYYNSISPSLLAQGIDISLKSKQTMKSYFDGIDYFKDAYKYLSSYSSTRSNPDFDTYLSNSSKGFDTAASGRTTSLQEYFSFADQINNF